jgi:hypothetical protein
MKRSLGGEMCIGLSSKQEQHTPHGLHWPFFSLHLYPVKVVTEIVSIFVPSGKFGCGQIERMLQNAIQCKEDMIRILA